MKIYLAARFNRKREMQSYAQELIAMGHEVTSRWIYLPDDGTPNADYATPEQKLQEAYMDVEDVHAAEVLIFFGQPRGSANRGGGRWFELCLAWQAKKRCLVLLDGGHETIFTLLPEMEICHSWKEVWRTLHRV